LAKRSNKKSAGSNSTGRSSSRGASDSPMDVTLLERMVKLMSANDLNTVDVRDGDKRVILKRGAAFTSFAAPHTSAGGGPPMYASAHHPHTSASSSGLASGATTGGTASTGGVPEDANLISIKSPMVGTFYSAPSPDAKPFVSVGSAIDEETDVCVIEAMKVFNNIKAECRGTISKILVTNGQTVEFGQPLFLVKP